MPKRKDSQDDVCRAPEQRRAPQTSAVEKKPAYWQLLKDPRWQQMRLKIMERDGWACAVCSSKEKTLNVHHGCYLKGRMPWEYDEQILHTLCEDCHEDAQSKLVSVHTLLGAINPGDLEKVSELLAAIHRRAEIACNGAVLFKCQERNRRLEYELSLLTLLLEKPAFVRPASRLFSPDDFQYRFTSYVIGCLYSLDCEGIEPSAEQLAPKLRRPVNMPSDTFENIRSMIGVIGLAQAGGDGFPIEAWLSFIGRYRISSESLAADFETICQSLASEDRQQSQLI